MMPALPGHASPRRIAAGRTAAALVGWILTFAGCTPVRSQAVTANDPQGPDRPSYDPARALLTFEELEPAGAVVGQPTAEAKPLSPRGARRIEKALRLYAQQRHTEAGLELERALQTDPDSYQVHLQLARVLRAGGSTERCRTHLQRALELGPDDLVLHYLLAASLPDDAPAAEAIRELRIALICGNAEAVPDFRALTLFRLAELLEGEGYLTAALEQYRLFEEAAAGLDTGAEIDPELTTLLQVTGGRTGRARSAIYERLGKFDQAIKALSDALEGQTPEAATRERLTRLLSMAGRHAEAVAQARMLVAEDASAIDLLLETYARLGRPDGALDDLADLAAEKPNDSRYLLAYVAALERLGRADQAEVELKRFSQAHPGQLEVRWRLFDSYAARSAWSDALAVAADVVALDAAAAPEARSKLLELPAESGRALLEGTARQAEPQWASSYLLGCLALQLERLDEANSLLKQAHRARPEFLAARIELGAVYNARYCWEDTLALLGDLAQGDEPIARVEWLVGQAYDGLDDEDRATLHYRAAARLNPGDTRVLIALGGLRERNGDYLRAIRQYRAALEVNPLDEETREDLFRAYLHTGDRNAAAAQLAELRKIAASPNRIARCMAHLQNDPRAPDPEKFRRPLIEAMAASGPDSRSLTYVALSYIEQAEYQRALEVLERAVALAPDDVDALLLAEYAYRMTLQFDKSARTLRALLQRHPRRAQWIHALINVLVTQQTFDQALVVIRQQLARAALGQEERDRYRDALLDVLRDARRYNEWIETVKRWQAEAPDDIDLRVSLIGAYVAAERPEDALSVVEAWFREEPDNGSLRESLVELLVEVGRAERAVQTVLDALGHDPDNDGLQLELIRTLSSAGRPDDALELAANCLVGTGNALDYQQAMLVVYDDAQRFDDAVTLLGDLLHQADAGGRDASPLDRDRLRRFLAGTLIQAERYNEAQNKLTRWIERSSDPETRFEYLKLLSACHQERGQLTQALEALEQAYALRPLDEGINNDLGYSWADAGLRLAEAEKCLRYAVAQNPRNAAFLDSLGWVLYKRGDNAGAVKWLTLAVGARAGDDPVIHNHLGDAHWLAGDRDRALENWRSAQRLAVEKLAGQPRINAAEYRRVAEGAGEKIARLERGETPEVAPLGGTVETTPGAPVSNRSHTGREGKCHVRAFKMVHHQT